MAREIRDAQARAALMPAGTVVPIDLFDILLRLARVMDAELASLREAD